MTLLLVAALGIIFARWLGIARRVSEDLAIVSTGAVDGGHSAGLRNRSSRMYQPPSVWFRMVVYSAALLCSVAAGILVVQTQTVARPRQEIAQPDSATGAQFYLKRGESFSGAHQYDRAIADYTTAIQLKPDYAEAYNDRGFAYYLKGDAKRAIADYTRAIELRPNYPKAYNSRGVAYMAHGYGSAKSVPDFDRAIALDPNFRYAYINRANARLASHPWLALQDFHHAGMYPERTVAKVVGSILAVIVGIAWIRRRRRGRANDAA